ncbi:MAG: hypothetical protein ABW022_11205 [Actinoplanes sp.]
MAQPESRLSRAIKAAIRAGGGYCVKIHGGPTMEAGTPDILACIPVRKVVPIKDGEVEVLAGQFVGIETKMPDGGDPTPIQRHRHDQIKAVYGVVLVPRSVQDAVKALEALGWQRRTPDTQ